MLPPPEEGRRKGEKGRKYNNREKKNLAKEKKQLIMRPRGKQKTR